jgi:hypothetical protein
VDVVVRGIVLTSLVDDNVAAADGLSWDVFFFDRATEFRR